mgnify:CR=1 FL=1
MSTTSVLVEEEAPFLDFGRFSSDQVLARRALRLGDSELAFSVASRIVEGDFEVGSQEHWYAEPQGAFAGFDYDKLLVVCGTQWPYHVRDTVAGALGVPPAEIAERISWALETLWSDEETKELDAQYAQSTDGLVEGDAITRLMDAPTIVKRASVLSTGAIEQRASDIHLEPQRQGIMVRDRIDGVLKRTMDLNEAVGAFPSMDVSILWLWLEDEAVVIPHFNGEVTMETLPSDASPADSGLAGMVAVVTGKGTPAFEMIPVNKRRLKDE